MADVERGAYRERRLNSGRRVWWIGVEDKSAFIDITCEIDSLNDLRLVMDETGSLLPAVRVVPIIAGDEKRKKM